MGYRGANGTAHWLGRAALVARLVDSLAGGCALRGKCSALASFLLYCDVGVDFARSCRFCSTLLFGKNSCASKLLQLRLCVDSAA
jgi:hypothetical protein